MALDADYKAFIVYIIAPKFQKMAINNIKKVQIKT